LPGVRNGVHDVVGGDAMNATLSVRFMPVAPDETPCVTCHKNGAFTYQLEPNGIWVENDVTVPQAVLDRQPPDVRGKVMRQMTAFGVVPA
jgi:hypothetical protein